MNPFFYRIISTFQHSVISIFYNFNICRRRTFVKISLITSLESISQWSSKSRSLWKPDRSSFLRPSFISVFFSNSFKRSSVSLGHDRNSFGRSSVSLNSKYNHFFRSVMERHTWNNRGIDGQQQDVTIIWRLFWKYTLLYLPAPPIWADGCRNCAQNKKFYIPTTCPKPRFTDFIVAKKFYWRLTWILAGTFCHDMAPVQYQTLRFLGGNSLIPNSST